MTQRSDRPRPGPSAATLRVFFALWPPLRLARTLYQRAGVRVREGRRMRADTLHLTLAFIGAVPRGRLPALIDAGEQAARGVSPFLLSLDRLSWWRHNRIVWAGTSDPPPGLRDLAATLRERVRNAGFALPAGDFVAHVTLARKASGCELAGAMELPLDWPVRGFALVASERGAAGAKYTRLHSFGLLRENISSDLG